MVSPAARRSTSLVTIALAPETVFVSDPLDELVKGDIIIVKPGEKIPVDGIIVEGESHIDEKVVTGESFSVKKEKGAEGIGAQSNQEGRFKFQATKDGKD